MGFEPTCRLPDKTLSRRPRYDHFGTSPQRWVCVGETHHYSLTRAPASHPGTRTRVTASPKTPSHAVPAATGSPPEPTRGDDRRSCAWTQVRRPRVALYFRRWILHNRPTADVKNPGSTSHAEPTVVCTVGMHRSGTSLTSRLLNLLGVDLGPTEKTSSAGPDNPKGYWEHRPIADINDAILERFDGSWEVPPDFPTGWVDDPRLADLHDAAHRLLDDDFAGRPLWGWKDPRTTLTLPFWQSVVGPMRYVLCVRNPSAVMSSLSVRSSMPGPKAERLWLSYMAAMLRHTASHPRLFIAYEDVLEDRWTELQRLASFVGRAPCAHDAEVRQAAAAFSEPDLCHHGGSLEALLADERVSFPVKSLYAAVRARMRADVITQSAGHGVSDESLTLMAEDALHACDRLQSHARAARAEARAARAETLAAQAEEALAEIHGSVAWRAVQWSRRQVVSFAPPGSRRHHAYAALRRRVQSPENDPPRPSSPTLEAAVPVSTSSDVCLCTLAINAPYRQRARLLCADASDSDWVVVTDAPADFSDLGVRTVHREPSGPMAADYLARLPPTGESRGAAAYHDKRFAVQAALERHDTAIFLDADSRIDGLPQMRSFRPGLAVLPVVRKSIADHLQTVGSWRLPAFLELARDLMGDPIAIYRAAWCHETCYAVTKDGNERRFFWAWERAAAFLQAHGVHSGEGGVMGLAAAFAGWSVDFDILIPLGDAIRHEGGGPKAA